MDTLSADEKKLSQADVFGAHAAYTDHEIGCDPGVEDWQLDNTLIIYIEGDTRHQRGRNADWHAE
jgi:arylsulfatase